MKLLRFSFDIIHTQKRFVIQRNLFWGVLIDIILLSTVGSAKANKKSRITCNPCCESKTSETTPLLHPGKIINIIRNIKNEYTKQYKRYPALSHNNDQVKYYFERGVGDSVKIKEDKLITYSQVWRQYLNIKKHFLKTGTAAREASRDFDGMVIDETQSRMGKDFYDIFYKKWNSPKHLLNYNIIIKEKPVPPLGTQVMVYIDERNIFQSFLQPRFEIIKPAASNAVRYAREYLMIYHKPN